MEHRTDDHNDSWLDGAPTWVASPPPAAAEEAAPARPAAAPVDLDAFKYVGFENAFRGSPAVPSAGPRPRGAAADRAVTSAP